MKRFVFLVISFVLLFVMLTPIAALAAEVGEEISSGEGGYHDIFTRLFEFVKENKTEVISAAGSGALLVFNAVTKRHIKKKNKEITDALEIIGGDAAGTAKSQGSVIGAVNTMAAGYNEMRAAYEKYEAVEDDRNKLVGACLVTNTALLEMMNCVFVHNKNLPQGAKDFVLLQYTNCLKALSDDKLLGEIVESVREKINAAGELKEAVTEDEEQD